MDILLSSGPEMAEPTLRLRRLMQITLGEAVLAVGVVAAIVLGGAAAALHRRSGRGDLLGDGRVLVGSGYSAARGDDLRNAEPFPDRGRNTGTPWSVSLRQCPRVRLGGRGLAQPSRQSADSDSSRIPDARQSHEHATSQRTDDRTPKDPAMGAMTRKRWLRRLATLRLALHDDPE